MQAAASEGRLDVIDALKARGYSCTPSMCEEAAAVAVGRDEDNSSFSWVKLKKTKTSLSLYGGF